MHRLCLPLLLSLLTLLHAGEAHSQFPIPPHEREALIALYRQTNGDQWRFNIGWLGPVGTECDWLGVSCVCDLGDICHVSTIHLGNNNLRGWLPRRIGALKFLHELALPINRLEGRLPKEIGSLQRLRYLDLNLNRIAGTLPRELGSPKSLRYLNLSSNRLEGKIPGELGNLTHLEELYLSGNKLSGTLPPQLANLENLLALTVGTNQLSGEIPRWLGELKSMVLLSLGRNEFSGVIPPELFEARNLSSLGLEENHLTGRIPEEISKLTQLRILFVGGNRLMDRIPWSITKLQSLDTIYLDWNALYSTDSEVVEFLDARSLFLGWEITQTLAPEGLAARSMGPTSVRLTWAPVNFHPDLLNAEGGYLIYTSPDPNGPFERRLTLQGKDSQTTEITGLRPGTSYFFRIRTFSRRHEENPNTPFSGWSATVQATTE